MSDNIRNLEKDYVYGENYIYGEDAHATDSLCLTHNVKVKPTAQRGDAHQYLT